MMRLIHAIWRRMPFWITDCVKNTWLHKFYQDMSAATRARSEIAEWKAKGRPVPPPHPWKQSVVRQYGRHHRLSVLVETGTFLGDMVNAMRGSFIKVYSIELDPSLFKRAQARFVDCNNVILLNGDSGKVMSSILSQLDKAALFWLDGHYSEGITARGEKETPVLNELRSIFEQRNLQHIVLIDDARCFNGTHDYPSVSELRAFVIELKPTANFTIEDDIIRID